MDPEKPGFRGDMTNGWAGFLPVKPRFEVEGHLAPSKVFKKVRQDVDWHRGIYLPSGGDVTEQPGGRRTAEPPLPCCDDFLRQTMGGICFGISH